jgi:hypothetical protein
MEPGSPVPVDLAQRVARLEAQVAWLLQQGQAPRPAAPAPRAPQPAAPSQPPVRPAREVSPVVWIAGIGAALFLAGAVFFFRWAVQQGWMGPELRFALGLLVGGGLTAFAARLALGANRRLGIALLLAGLGSLQFTFRAGAFSYRFFDPLLGLVAVAVLTLLAGALAARIRSGGALTVALASGLAAPLAFSQGGHHEVALAVYLAVLMAATLAVPYLARAGGAWIGARWTALAGTWLLLLAACVEVARADAALLGLLLLVHLLLAGLLAWLPGTEARPGAPATLWLAASILATAFGWLLWKRLGWTPELYAGPVLAAGAWNLGLVKPARRRLGGRSADLPLLALAAGHLALAVPVALAWHWVGPLWGAFAVALAWAAHRRDGAGSEEAAALRWLALGVALLATGRWAFHGLDGAFEPWRAGLPFLRSAFAEGALAAAAWGLLVRDREGLARLLAFLALQVTANVTLAVEAARLVHWLQAPDPRQAVWAATRAASIALTLVWALSGAWQWMRGLGLEGAPRRALLGAGYAWMGIAALKLLLADLATADTPLRALAFLGVGAIGMTAATLARRHRPEAHP